MKTEPTTEENKGIERIAKRWSRHKRRWRIFCFFAFIYGTDIPYRLGLPSWVDPFMLVIVISVLVFITRRATRGFAKHLDKEDRQFIIQYAETDPRFRHLIKVCKIDAEKEYLRPSQPSHDDSILLRAAAYTADTPQDQLLRGVDGAPGTSRFLYSQSRPLVNAERNMVLPQQKGESCLILPMKLSPFSRWFSVLALCLCASVVSIHSADAQMPCITTLFPIGGKSGSSVDVEIRGANLNGAETLLVSGAGVSGRVLPSDAKPDQTHTELPRFQIEEIRLQSVI